MSKFRNPHSLHRFADLLLDPLDKLRHPSINTGHLGASTSNSVRHHSDLVVVELGSIALRQHQRTSAIALARVLAALQYACAHNGIVKLFRRKGLSNLAVESATIVV